MTDRELNIGGMNFDNYDADRDPSGAIGHALADAKLREEGESYWQKRAEEEHYEAFARKYVSEGVGNFVDLKDVKWTNTHRMLLRTFGYTHLNGVNGEQIPIDKADKYRVRAVFEDVFEEARERGLL